MQDGSFPIPKLLIGKEDISQFIEEFRGFHAQFADCFSREEPRENFFQYMAGQMSQLERKSTYILPKTLAGAPSPFSIFIGITITSNLFPFAFSRFIRFSMIRISFDNSIR